MLISASYFFFVYNCLKQCCLPPVTENGTKSLKWILKTKHVLKIAHIKGVLVSDCVDKSFCIQNVCVKIGEGPICGI